MARRGKVSVLASALMVCTIGVAAAAQTETPDDDWDVATDPTQDLVIAGVEYASGAILAVECRAGALNAWISGLPTNAVTGGRFTRSLADGRSVDSYWTLSTSGTQLTSASAARDARSFKSGGVLALVSTEHKGAPLSLRLDLPAQSAGVDRVLTACGRPLSDPRDALPDVSPLLSEWPRIPIAESASRHAHIRVEISCIVSAGRLTACQSDNETPKDARVGAATARRANGHRLRLTDAAAAEGRLFELVVTGWTVRP